MLLIALLALAIVWVAVIAIVLGVCISAARGDRQLSGGYEPPAPVRTGRRFLRPVTR